MIHSPPRVMRARWAALAAMALSLSACEPDLTGRWEVVDFRRPGISAMGDQEAALWLGQTLEVTDSTATMGDHACTLADVTRETLPVRSVEMGFNVLAGDLGIAKERVDLYELVCIDGDLTAGSQLIRLARDSALTYWDGVFFLMVRREAGEGSGG